MKRNISEELNINDVITLDDGSEKKDELEKVAAELQKESQDIIDDKLNDLEEIRDAEAPAPEANDGFGKTLHIKNFVEKLTLSEEDDNVLNEDFNDKMFEKRSDAVGEVYRALEKYARWLYYDSNIDDEEFNLIGELEDVCDEALMHAELDQGEMLG